MFEKVSLFDRAEMESLRRKMKVDPQTVRRWRNDLLKHFISDAVALGRSPLADQVALHSLELRQRYDSQCDGATKLLLSTSTGMLIETVLLRIASGRTALCVSSQIGCAAACRFCATGTMGIARNLTVDQILDQVLVAGQLLAIEQRKIRNIVFMGMGEPFHNEANLHAALDALIAPDGFHHPATKILVSTVGISDAMLRLADRFPRVNLALSLHSVRQEVREQIIPLARMYPLNKLRETIVQINVQTSSPIMIEYLLLQGVNDSVADAHELISWLKELRVHVNLIPFNPIDQAPELVGSDQATRQAFALALQQAGINSTIRYSLGQDIEAACGQLVKKENRQLAMRAPC